jgi:hypothetical protein
MNTIVHIGDRSIDLQGLQELQYDSTSVTLLFGDEHDPPSLTLTGADAQHLRNWLDQYAKSHANGLDFMVPKPSKQPSAELIQQLRTIATTAEHPSDLLTYLRDQVNDEETFTDYLLATFGDDSLIWVIATRWWRGAYPGTNADTILRVALQETAHFWKPSE